jgi:hypothetical protein
MLDEVALRKPEWVEGYPVTLADGQIWHIPRPKFRFKPKFVDGKVEIGGGATFGPDLEKETEVLYGIVDAEPSEYMRVKFAMAVRLLGANYNLTAHDFGELIVLEPGDQASDARWEELSAALMGTPPKPSPAT